MKLVATVCDETATEVEQEEAIESLFGLLMSLRCGERIEGTFTDNDDFSDRLKNVEEKITAMNQLLNEFIIAFKSHKH